MIGNFLGYFEKPHSHVKTALATFWALFGKVSQLITRLSGHTALPLVILIAWQFLHYSSSLQNLLFQLFTLNKVQITSLMQAASLTSLKRISGKSYAKKMMSRVLCIR